MKVVKVDLPGGSFLKNDKWDFSDGYLSSFNDSLDKITSIDVGKAFFTSAPSWVDGLMKFRNKIVFFIGLKTADSVSNPEQLLSSFKCEPGEQLGLFKVLYKSETEVILGEDDKHLNFRISLFLTPSSTIGRKDLIISTTVQIQNWLGRVYFAIIKPFHKVIVPVMLKGIVRQMEEKIRVGSN